MHELHFQGDWRNPGCWHEQPDVRDRRKSRRYYEKSKRLVEVRDRWSFTNPWQIPTQDSYTILKRSRYICAATTKGAVNLLDPITFNIVKTWNAHSSMISDMDSQHDYIVTCGYSLRQQNNYMLDPLVNVFDLKNLISLPPIPFPAGAAYVRMHPRMSTTSIVVSQLGQMHIVDLMNVNTSNVRQANVLSYLTMLEIAPSGEALALADSECNVHLWGSPSRIRFAELSNPVDFANPEEEPEPMDWDNA